MRVKMSGIGTCDVGDMWETCMETCVCVRERDEGVKTPSSPTCLCDGDMWETCMETCGRHVGDEGVLTASTTSSIA